MPMRPTSLLLLASFCLVGCRAQIHHGLTERDANEVLTALASRGFEATKVLEQGKKPAFAIELPNEQASEALRVLTELELPRPTRVTTKELTAQTGLIETPSAERLRQLEGLEGDLEQMLETMDGVASASVELVVAQAPRPGQPVAPSKASALLRVEARALERLEGKKAHVASLIAGAVENLKTDDVTVLLDEVPTRQAPAPPPSRFPEHSLRWSVAALGAGLVLVSGMLLVLLLRGRRRARVSKPAASPPRPAPQPSPKPVLAASVQRKVA